MAKSVTGEGGSALTRAWITDKSSKEAQEMATWKTLSCRMADGGGATRSFEGKGPRAGVVRAHLLFLRHVRLDVRFPVLQLLLLQPLQFLEHNLFLRDEIEDLILVWLAFPER